jgi:outer membrane protein TolC
MIKMSLFLVFILASYLAISQQVLSEDVFKEIMLRNHPLAKQADIIPQMGQSTLLKAKGGFDPKLNFVNEQKYYNGYQYYSMMNTGLKVPTWYGVEVKTGFDSNRGTYLNPEGSLPDGGLWYGGISMNLGQGLIIDQRRSDLFKAKKINESSNFEKIIQLNELVYKGGYTYWNWFFSFHARQILIEALDIANQRYLAVKRTAELGDRPQIDVVEAGIQVQNRTALLKEYEKEFLVASSELGMYLWNEKTEPLELAEATIPKSKDSIFTSIPQIDDKQLDESLENHPYLKVADFKIEMLGIDQRLKKEMLKPQLNLQYNLLNEPVNYNPFNQLSINNYKWGVNFEMPLFLRKERGDLAMGTLKLQEAELNRDNKKAELKNKIQSALLEWKNSVQQLDIYSKSVEDTKKLLEAERSMFENGESSLFLINAREMSYFQACLKYLELQTKNKQTELSYRFASSAFGF